MGLILGGRPDHGTTGHLQSSVCRLQDPEATGTHNTCFQQVQDDISKTQSVSKEWDFVSKDPEISLGTSLTIDVQTEVVSDEDISDIYGRS